VSAPLVVVARIETAIAAGRPVVALETTLVTHGLPAGEGLACAEELEDIVRAAGAEPATIGVLDGALRVGLSRDERGRLAAAPDVAKLNLANLGVGVASGRAGSTTVAATLLAAHRAGIRVMATGGIGGVHRGASESFDVSSDLAALARFPVAVVCAGAKAVLDLAKTVEVLETLGVPVLGFRTDRFPAFYRRDSGLPVDARFDEMDALAEAVAGHFALTSGVGLVMANPVPVEDQMGCEVYEDALSRALAEAEAAGVRGRAVTPFLLARLDALTASASVRVNRALLAHNARVAAGLAVALAARG
jgi:pseudouridine-5'-phosphate glycosidase